MGKLYTKTELMNRGPTRVDHRTGVLGADVSSVSPSSELFIAQMLVGPTHGSDLPFEAHSVSSVNV